MISNASAPQDPNYAFGETPPSETRKTGKTQKQIKTPKRKKNIHPIGFNIGSDDDDKDYTPRKSKRKRTSSAANSDPASSKKQENSKAAPVVIDTASPTKERPPERARVDQRRKSFFDSANLIERFKYSKQSLGSPNYVPSSQDSLASTSQSQRSVDVVQQYPEMSEQMHTFPAEPQVALMSPTTKRNQTGSSNLADNRGAQPPLDYHNEARGTTGRDAPGQRQRREPSLEDITNSNQGMPMNQIGPSHPNEVTEYSTRSPQITGPPSTPPISNTAPAPRDQPRMSSSDRTPTEQDWSRVRMTSNIETRKHTVEPEHITYEAYEDSAAQSERRQEVHAPQPISAATSYTSTIVQNPIRSPSTDKSTVQDTAAHQPAIQQHTAQQPPTPQTPNSKPQAVKPALQVRYWIVESRIPEYNLVKWLAGGLLNKSLDSLCNEIAIQIGRPVSRSITVNLKTSEGNVRSEILCDKPETFTELQEDFARVIKRHKKKGNTMFEITLEPDPSAGMIMPTGGVVEDGGEDSAVEF